MRAKLATSAALTALLLTVSPLPFSAPGLPVGVDAVAAQEARVSVDLFFDELAPYGRWTSRGGIYVFVPTDVDDDWEPYRDGHWVYTDRYGWYWVSDEPFAWATYHYGRWGYDEEIGWYWVPGTVWGPAWVSWRRGGDYVGWAPLPPDDDDSYVVSVEVGDVDIPEDRWVFVERRSFLEPDLRVVIVDRPERRRVYEETEPLGTVVVENNVVVNNVVQVNYIEEATGRRVERREVESVDRPDAGRDRRDRLTAFSGEIAAPDRDVSPREVTDREELRRARAERRGRAPGEERTRPQQDEATPDRDQAAPAETGEEGDEADQDRRERGEEADRERRGDDAEQERARDRDERRRGEDAREERRRDGDAREERRQPAAEERDGDRQEGGAREERRDRDAGEERRERRQRDEAPQEQAAPPAAETPEAGERQERRRERATEQPEQAAPEQEAAPERRQRQEAPREERREEAAPEQREQPRGEGGGRQREEGGGRQRGGGGECPPDAPEGAC